MKQIGLTVIIVIALSISSNIAKAQEDGNKLKLSGDLLIDQRFLLEVPNDWAWNENRLTLELNKKITGNSKFYSEVWLRNIGLPGINSSADLYNKGIVDPYNLEVREAYVQLFGFLTKNLDVKIGRQRITWGTADKLNPTDNLNPYDLEDVLDFGRHRGSDAISLDYYFNSEFSLQGVYIPFFQPANMPVGTFANALTSTMELPQGMTLMGFTDQINMPQYNAGSIGGVGVWAEAAAFLPENEVLMTNDLSAMYALPSGSVTQDTTVLDKKAYVKFVLGADYNFANGAYLNVQYLHGFINERGTDNLNDYFFVQLDKKFFDDKLKIAPLAGGFIVSDWDDMKNNYAIVYVPNISYMATDNAEITLSAAIFDGKGNNMFANLADYNMMMFKLKYSF
jgi:hypothetical protein